MIGKQTQQTARSISSVKKVYVSGIDKSNPENPVAQTVDLLTGGQFLIPLSRSSREYPREGEVWLVDRSLGQWRFDSMVGTTRRPEVTNYAGLISYLSEIGLIDYKTEQGNVEKSHFQSATGGYIGEIRFFSDAISSAPDGWLMADGSYVYKWHYPILYTVIGEFYGGDTTRFRLPYISSMTNTVAMICAY